MLVKVSGLVGFGLKLTDFDFCFLAFVATSARSLAGFDIANGFRGLLLDIGERRDRTVSPFSLLARVCVRVDSSLVEYEAG